LLSDLVNVDVTVGGTGEQSVTVSRPLEGDAPWDTGLRGFLGGKFIQDVLVFQIPDLDGSIGGCAQPVVLRREAHSVDGAVGIQGIQVLTVVNIPQHSGTVLTTGTTQTSIRRDGDGVKDTGVASQVGFQLAVVQVPNLDQTIPTARHDQRVLGGRREADTGDPVGVVVLGDGVLALSQGVPQTDGLIAGPGDNLTVVSGESDGVDILGVSTELTDGGTGVQIPQTHGGIHGTSQSELTIGRDDGVAHGLVVTMEATTGVTRTSLAFFWGVVTGQFPDQSLLVTGTRNNQIGLFVSGGNGSDPVAVALKGSTVRDFSHLV